MSEHEKTFAEIAAVIMGNLLTILGAIFGIHPLKSFLLPLTLLSVTCDGYLLFIVFKYYSMLLKMVERSHLSQVVDELVEEEM